MKLGTAIGSLATLVCGAAMWQVIKPPTPNLIYNESESAPQGWYVVDDASPIKRGAVVAAFAPAEARTLAHNRGYLPHNVPIIKTVWSIGGEEICSENGVIRAPNRPDISVMAQDGSGRELPSWDGCITLDEDEFFLVSTDVQTSFDSRYFGAVPLENILGTARLLGESRND